jgi:F0F1-type ATP synthase assembly protein I
MIGLLWSLIALLIVIGAFAISPILGFLVILIPVTYFMTMAKENK